MQNLAEKFEQPLIQPQAPSGEEDKVNEILENIEKHLGFVPDGLRLYSLSPALLETFVGNIAYFNMGGTDLPPSLTAMIRYIGSSQAGCSFCIDMNEGFLSNMGFDLEQVRAAQNNPDAAPLEEKEKTLLRLAIKSINAPEQVAAEDLDNARKQGWTDRDIFDSVAQAANNRAFNFILRTFKIEHQGSFA